MSDRRQSASSKKEVDVEEKSEKWDRNSKMPPQMMKRWFGHGKETDEEVTRLFKDDLIGIGHGNLTHW